MRLFSKRQCFVGIFCNTSVSYTLKLKYFYFIVLPPCVETIQLCSGSFPTTIKDVSSSFVGLLKQVHLSWSSGLTQILNGFLKINNKSPVVHHISFSGSAGVAVLTKHTYRT